MSTRHEVTGTRDLDFSRWVRCNLPGSDTGFMASDLDFILQNYKTKEVMLIEVKTRGKEMATWQRLMLRRIERWMSAGMDDGWVFKGLHVVTFQNTGFHDGAVFLNGKRMSEEEVKRFLSFERVE